MPGGRGVARDLARLKDSYLFICEMWYSLPSSGRRDSEINIDGQPEYHTNESANVEEIEFFSDSREES